jgi:hypothetical protein
MIRLLRKIILYIRTNFLGYRQEGIDWDYLVAPAALQLRIRIDKDILQKIYCEAQLEKVGKYVSDKQEYDIGDR